MLERWIPLALVVALLLPSAAGGAVATDAVDRVTAEIICDCGCSNLTVKDCTCGKADQVRADVRARLDSGQSGGQVLKAYVDEYGEQILAAPTRKGFNLVGWLAPFAALLLAGSFLVLILRRWARVPWREAPLVPPLGAGEPRPPEPSFLKRVEEELNEVER